MRVCWQAVKSRNNLTEVEGLLFCDLTDGWGILLVLGLCFVLKILKSAIVAQRVTCLTSW